ncbi:dNA protection during starvation protein 2 [Clostridium sp. CAG:389]|nr:dNA protection during starvation protein 2 [Clostridium sp. CAG:389]
MELENKLNEFLADLNIFYRKLQNYHWNIEGKDFFQVHAKLEELYDEINEQIDEIAEHIAILGGQPLGTMKDYLEKSSIKEAENKKIKSEEIYNNILSDYEELLKKTIEIKEKSENEKEYSTSSLIDDYIKEYGKIIWMIKSVKS